MISINNMSFKGKMLLYAVASAGTALVLCGIAVVTVEWKTSRHELSRNLGIQAEVLALNVTAALSFDDTKSANQTLAGLKGDEEIVCAHALSSDGKKFAQYMRPGSEVMKEAHVGPNGYRFAGNRLHISRPIVLDGEEIGSIYLQYDLRHLDNKLKRILWLMVVGMIIALAVAFVVSFKLQAVLTRPVTELARTTQAIATNKDYSVRAVKHTNDELGMLTDAFNHMLSQIQDRDKILRASHEKLETLVEERTASLRESESKIRALIGEIDAIVWQADGRTWQFDFVSERAEAILGYPAQQWLSEPDFWVNHLHPDDRDRTVAICRETTDRGEDHEFSYRAIAADGRVVWIRDFVRVTKDESGDIQLRGLMVDITEQKRIEADLAVALEKAEAANRIKSEFLANMSHEIRTPMTAICGFADVLLEHGDIQNAPPERIEAATTIKRNSEHLLAIINNILDLSKIEAGELFVEHISCSPCMIVADVLSLMRERAETRALTLSVEYDGAIPETIQSDPTRLRQILINLVGNAIKFTKTGTVRLKVRLLRSDHAKSMLQFEVHDTGIGMSEEQLTQVFSPFAQADSSMTRKYGGTGLGLTISRRLARILGGDLTAESEVERGSAFRVTIATGSLDGVKMFDRPSEAYAAQEETTQEKTTIRPRTTSDRLDCRILLVEDGADNRRLISFLLEKAGAEVAVAENGKIGAEAALAARDGGHPYDLILMDMQMPVMNGYEATLLLREKGFNCPIIALTAHAMSGDRDKCLATGCNDYATKPIDREMLIEMIRKNLQPLYT